MSDSRDKATPEPSAIPTRDRVVQTALAAVLSVFLAGAGQAYNGQWAKGFAFVVASFLMWFLLLGWVMHIWAVIDAGVVRWYQTGAAEAGERDHWRELGLTVALVVAAKAFICTALWLGGVFPF